jgi:hypothetical protein
METMAKIKRNSHNSNNARKKRIQARQRVEKSRIDSLRRLEVRQGSGLSQNDSIGWYTDPLNQLLDWVDMFRPVYEQSGAPKDEYLADLIHMAIIFGVDKEFILEFTREIGYIPVILSSSPLIRIETGVLVKSKIAS